MLDDNICSCLCLVCVLFLGFKPCHVFSNATSALLLQWKYSFSKINAGVNNLLAARPKQGVMCLIATSSHVPGCQVS